MVDKFPVLPKKLFNQEWTITVNQEGISEYGEPMSAATITAKCWFNGKATQVMNAEKQIIRIEGALVAQGDLFPTLEQISTGTAEKSGKAYKIYRCQRPLNPDGAVYATVLELM